MSSGRYGKYGEIQRIRRLHPRGSVGRGPMRHPGPPTRQQGLRGRHPRQVGIRQARSSDAGFIHRLSGIAFQDYGPYGDVLRNGFDSGRALCLIAHIHRRPAGFAMVERISELSDPPVGVELLAIAVDPSERRRGAGRALLRRIETRALRQGAFQMWLHTATDNHPARSLFERSGYRTVRLERAFYPQGQDALLMGKLLRQPSA